MAASLAAAVQGVGCIPLGDVGWQRYLAVAEPDVQPAFLALIVFSTARVQFGQVGRVALRCTRTALVEVEDVSQYAGHFELQAMRPVALAQRPYEMLSGLVREHGQLAAHERLGRLLGGQNREAASPGPALVVHAELGVGNEVTRVLQGGMAVLSHYRRVGRGVPDMSARIDQPICRQPPI